MRRDDSLLFLGDGACCEAKAVAAVHTFSEEVNNPTTSMENVQYVPWTWAEARGHFKSADPGLHVLVSALPDPKETPQRTAYESLARAIIGQQLSTKAAATIWVRFTALHGDVPSPAVVLATGAEVHRSVGVSGQKHGYLQDLARHYLNDPAAFDDVEHLSDPDIIASWTRVKGLGAWTVQMHLMFQLRRPDVFAVDDLGVRRAMERAFAIPADSPKPIYAKRAQSWGPFRTAACRFLWDSLNNQPK